MTRKRGVIEARGEKFAERQSTNITLERPSARNPYLVDETRWYGYDVLELMVRKTPSEVAFLLLRGELPEPADARLFDALLVALANPGPRHPGTSAAVVAASGKTRLEHLLPIGLGVAGSALAGGEVEPAMRFLRKHRRRSGARLAELLLQQPIEDGLVNDRLAPGIGRSHGGVDPYPQKVLGVLRGVGGDRRFLTVLEDLSSSLKTEGWGILMSGVVAAALLDLGFHPRYGGVLFQWASGPGILAHAMEYATRPHTALPSVDDDRYQLIGESSDG